MSRRRVISRKTKVITATLSVFNVKTKQVIERQVTYPSILTDYELPIFLSNVGKLNLACENILEIFDKAEKQVQLEMPEHMFYKYAKINFI